MKKLLLITFSVMACMASYGQSEIESFTQPTRVRGLVLNSSGEITEEYPSEFSYFANGKVLNFRFLKIGIHTEYSYVDGDYLSREFTIHSAEHPYFEEAYNYTYENGLVKTRDHIYYGSYYDSDIFWRYTYDEYGRLRQLDKNDGGGEHFYYHWAYEYPNHGKTKIETFFTDYDNEGVKVYRETTYTYDDNYTLLSKQVVSYNSAGNFTGSTLSTWTYNAYGTTDHVVSQVLSEDGTWINSTIKYYIRDDYQRIVEYQAGTWSAENEDWDINEKTIYDYNDEELLLTVSFHKKVNGEWKYNSFQNQTIFHNQLLKIQEKALAYYKGRNINKIIFHLQYTDRPTYLSTKEDKETRCMVYPNPGNDLIKITTPNQNAVIRFYDLNSKLLLSQPLNSNTRINTASWPKGIYLWELWTGNEKETAGKWVKE